MKSLFKSILFNVVGRSLFLLILVLFLLVLFMQPVQGSSLTESSFINGPDCNFTTPVPQTRPPSEDETTKVSIGIYLIDILYLDEIRESFETIFFMKLQWQDLRLAQKLQNRSIPYCNIKLDDIWNPEPYVYKHRRLTKEFDKIVSVDSQGTVTYRQIFDAELVSPLNFTKYPFDTQHLMIKIFSLPNQPERVELVEDRELNRVSEELSFVGWSVGEAKTQTKFFPSQIFQKPVPFFLFEVEIKRQSGFFVWKAIFPLLILVSVVNLVFWVEASNIVPRVSLSTITLLSVIAYVLSLPSQIPRVPYLTAEDIFLIGSMLLIVLALTETIVTHRLNQLEQKALALRIDIWLRWLFPILIIGLLGIAFL